ncbi:CLUMA_CG011960, isoform A [Clunio marinus]|uniref:CLUMA_CG011960, isoform A n=1 Tax=Clunio marinus TaxID=568069 RepID=A0A1J1IHJ1_9DIPT|nr:CLUMA_CG011960, isoform A [Clunio marinus]
MNEPGLDRRSLTPCLDENGVDDENACMESSKEIELSDISDIEDWNKISDGAKANGNGSASKEATFKKITQSTRERNYRDNIRRKNDNSGQFYHRQTHQPSYRRFDNKRREMERYNVRNVVASRDFSISKSRSRSPRIANIASRHRSKSFSPKRDIYRRRSITPTHYSSNRYKSPIRRQSSVSKHSRSPSFERYQNYKYKRSPTPEPPMRKSRSRHKSDRIRTSERSSKRKKHRTKDRHRKHKKSRSKSKPQSSSPSISPEPESSLQSASNTRQIMNVASTNLPQENIKVVLRNEEVVGKRSKFKKRDKKMKKEKVPRKEILDVSNEKRQKKHKRKKVKNKREQRERVEIKAPETPPLMKSRRKSDMKPIAIIDLEKSPGKEMTQSPKEVIILSDSEGDGKKRDGALKDVIIIEDVLLDKNILSQTPGSASTPVPQQPVLKFALKSKSNILPFNLLHDQAEEIEEQEGSNNNNNNNNNNSNNVNESLRSNQQKDQLEMANISMEDKGSNQREAYDPFEPTKSGSTSPVTPPPPNDVSSSSDMMMKSKIESPKEKILSTTPLKETTQIPGLGTEEHLISSSSVSIWNRKEFDKKQIVQQQQPTTPPLPPTFSIFSGTATTAKQHVSLYEGIYGNDLKTPVLPSPAKQSMKSSHEHNKSLNKNNNNNDDDDDEDGRTPYSPSSDGYDFEPPPAANTKHDEQQMNDPGSGSSYTFSSNDDAGGGILKSGPMKLTASALKTFNSTMRSTGPVGLQFVNKAELSIFENYLQPSQQNSPLVKRQSSSSFLRSKISRFTNSLNENGSPAMTRGSINYHEPIKPPMIDDSMLDDEIPNSAVDLINKDRFLKKSLRIERVAEEVKLVLKPHYNKKYITKEEYKEILRKAVPKICHNKTGEINIQKIHALVEAYIKKVRYKRKAGHIASSI